MTLMVPDLGNVGVERDTGCAGLATPLHANRGLGGIQDAFGWEAVFLQSWAVSAWVGIQEGPDPLM